MATILRIFMIRGIMLRNMSEGGITVVDASHEIRIGDVIQTKKPHPCGSSEWTVTRTGADIKIKCSGCGRIVLLDRETFLKRRKKVITQGPAVTQEC